MENSTELTYKDFNEYKVAEKIWIFVSPCLILVGTVSNILSIIVLVRKSMRRTTTMFYLTVLSFGNLFVLYTGLLRYWLIYAFEVDLRLLSDFGCKLHVFIVYVSLDFTTWILVAVSVDRCISVFRPLKAKLLCSINKAKVVVIVIVLALVVINIHFFATVGVIEYLEEVQCIGLDDLMRSIWPWFDFSVFSFIPFSVMIVCNVIIIRQIILARRRIKAHDDHDRIRSFVNRSQAGENGTQGQKQKSIRVSAVPSITMMLLTVSCVFLILTVPIVVWIIGYPHWYVPDSASQHYRAVLQLLWAIFNIMQYTNNSIHFFLYCLTGPRFRRELKAVFKKENKIAAAEPTVTIGLY